MKPIYAVKDTAVQAFGNPIIVRSQGEIMRSLQDEVNGDQTKSAIAQHPEDYELYIIGHWDDKGGRIEALDAPDLVTRCKDLLVPQQ